MCFASLFHPVDDQVEVTQASVETTSPTIPTMVVVEWVDGEEVAA